MKKITALFFLLAGLNTTAQNWKLLDENKTYFYKHSDSLLITNTIKIDSTVNSVLDSVFHIHTTIKVCDTCTVIPSDAVGGVLFHAYAPEIFGNTPAYNVSSNDYQFSDGIIKQDAELSDTWIFNPLLSINATVVDKYEITLFGSLDSIKVIELSTLDTILISKNHGVLRYPDFENAGKYFLLCGFHEGQNSFGEYLPNMWRIYDFNVGDVFYYSHHLSYLSSIPDQCYEGINAKLSIVNVNPSAYSPSYNFFNTQEYYFGCLISGEHQEGTSNGPANYTIDSIRAYYENTYSGITSVAVVPDSWMLNPFYPFQYNSFEVDSPYILGTAVRRNFILHRFDNGYVKYIQTMSNFSDSLYFISNVPDIQLKMEFREGFGRTYLEIYQFENVRTDELTSWIIDGDTTGNVYQFSESPELVKNDLNFYPNPATTEIHLPENLQRISFISLSGQQVLSSENPKQTIFIGDLPKGIYLVQAIDASGNLSTTKLIIE